MLGGLLALPSSATAAPSSRSQAYRDGRGNALLVRVVRLSAGQCKREPVRRGIEIRRRKAGARATRVQRLGSRCDAAYPSVAVATDGTALITWRQDGRIRVGQGSTTSGVRDAGTLSAKGSASLPGPIAIDPDGRAVITLRRLRSVYAVSRTESGLFSRAQRLGGGTGELVPAISNDGSVIVAWTTTAAGGEVGTSPANRLVAARRSSADVPFTHAEEIATGVLRDVVAASGSGGTAVGWTAEEVPRGGVSGVTFAPTGQPFESPFAFALPTVVTVDLSGTTRARNATGSIRRTAASAWVAE